METDQEGHGDNSRAARKRAVILEAAGHVFLANGYVGTSMDEIAASAAVSKQTVYKHFGDKESLFSELVTTTTRQVAELAADDTILRDETAFDQQLRAFARRLLHALMQPRVLQLRRLIIGEANRFPELGRLYLDAGVRQMTQNLSTVLSSLVEKGELRVDDPLLAAGQLIWLVAGIPLNRAMLLGNNHGLDEGDLGYFADTGVDTFLAAYARPPAVRSSRKESVPKDRRPNRANRRTPI